MIEDEMVGLHHQVNRHEFEQALGDCQGQGSLACSSSWGCKESDDLATEQQKITLDKRETTYSHQKQPIDSHQ